MCVQERVVINILHGLLIKVTFLLITYISSQFFSGNTLKMQVSGYLYVLVKYISFFPSHQIKTTTTTTTLKKQKKPTKQKTNKTKSKNKTEQKNKQNKNQNKNLTSLSWL